MSRPSFSSATASGSSSWLNVARWPAVKAASLDDVSAIVGQTEFTGAGNLVTDIANDRLAGVPQGHSVTVKCDEHETVGIDNVPLALNIAGFGAVRTHENCFRRTGD